MDRYHGLPISAADLLWGLGSVVRLHRKPLDPGLLLQQFPPPHAFDSLLTAAKAVGFEARFGPDRLDRIRKIDLPCFGALRDESSGVELVLITALDEERVQFFSRSQPAAQIRARNEFQSRLLGQTVRIASPTSVSGDADAREGPPVFGFRWFIPELLKHRKIWRDVLIASLCIQALGLATPLFTQVIIDKVVVHQTLSTLAIVASGLVMFLLFSAALSWARQYLILHTGNRVDAVLGSQVFGHLLDLPPRYFERRPTGVVISRIQAVETIREFVTGAAVALVLDLPFLVVFLAVMFWYSWFLTLIALGFLAAIAVISVGVVPTLRARLNEQFLLGARNQAFLTEYVSGMETVKSLQMEPQLKRTFGDYLAGYLQAGFRTRQLSNTFNVAATTLEQLMTVSVLCVGAWYVMNNVGFTIGMLVAFRSRCCAS